MDVAKKYGIIHPNESTTSVIIAVFIIDPEQTIRAIIYYPLNADRNMDEILRLIDALQTVDEHNVATPANWRPGDKVIAPPPKTTDSAEKHMGEGYECIDWFLCKKKL